MPLAAAIHPRELFARQFRSLRIYNYRVYFCGQLVSLIGTWMQTVGQAWLVLQLTGSPLALGTVTTLQFLPITLFTLFGGVFADRFPKRRVLIVAQLVALAQAFLLGLLVVTGLVALWHVYALALLLGMVNAIDGPVRQSFVVELVGREQLPNAVALNSSIFNSARILGPAVGGVLIGAFGISTTFFFNAASYVAVLAAYAAMRPADFRSTPPRRAEGNVFHQVGEGIRYAVGTPAVFYLVILLAFIGTFGYNFTVVIPLVARFVLDVGPEQFGFLTSCMGFGSLVAAQALAARSQPSTRLAVGAAAGFTAALFGIAISPWYALTAALLAAMGAAAVGFSTTINTSLQLRVPDELRGRVMSIFFLLVAGSTPIGGYLTGFLAERFGVTTAVLTLAAMCAVGIALATAYRASRPGRAPAVAAKPSLAGDAGPSGGH